MVKISGGKASHFRPQAERYATGKTLRKATSRESLGDFSAPNRDANQIFEESNAGRLPSLIPIRRQRMGVSAFTFLRGSAALMAQDLASAPKPGINVQACGDCHLMNFGAFVSPEGNILFDINDFDETLPNVDFTVDVKRLAASVAIAALDAGESNKTARRIATVCAGAYRDRMLTLARLSPLEIWHSRVDLEGEAAELFTGSLSAKLRGMAARTRPDREEDKNFPHVKRDAKTGEWRIEDNPPLIYHVSEGADREEGFDLAEILSDSERTMPPEVLLLLSRYSLRDAVIKVVGVGSVGTRCAIGLYLTQDNDTLFLQIKEAQTSVLERLGGLAWIGQQGARVVAGQRIMQAASDLFLGWAQDRNSGRYFYVRHLKNRRLGSISELLEEKALAQYAALCGHTLARAHARSADPAIIAGYMGKSEAFDDAIASFAMLYAKQNDEDYQSFIMKDAKTETLIS